MVGPVGSSGGRRRRAGRRSERLRVAVLMGGPSSEHDVSLTGGACVATVLAGLDPYEVLPIVIDRSGQWRIPRRHVVKARASVGARGGVLADAEPAIDPRGPEAWKPLGGLPEGLAHLRDWPADVVMPVLHGRFGEDGTLQACLAAVGLPFVGSDARGSMLAFDKVRAKEVYLQHGLPTPDYEVVRAADMPGQAAAHVRRWEERFGFPLILKDPLGGSSLEVRKVGDDGEALAAAQELMAGGADRILVEAFVAGRELTVGVLEDRDGPHPLPVVEIRPRGRDLFDFQQKYADDGAEELCPAPLEPDVAERAAALGVAAHRALGLGALSRTDLMLDAEGRLQILETNTLPGMTSRGLVPLAARTAGIDFTRLVERLVRQARRATP